MLNKQFMHFIAVNTSSKILLNTYILRTTHLKYVIMYQVIGRAIFI